MKTGAFSNKKASLPSKVNELTTTNVLGVVVSPRWVMSQLIDQLK
jgi:hypothetical protein